MQERMIIKPFMIRIELGPVLINPCFPEQLKSAPVPVFFIGDRGWNCQPGFRAGANFTPDIQSGSNSFRTLIHAWQAPMPSTAPIFQHSGVNPFSVISDD